jgi:hypothetical protein
MMPLRHSYPVRLIRCLPCPTALAGLGLSIFQPCRPRVLDTSIAVENDEVGLLLDPMKLDDSHKTKATVCLI